MKKKNNNKPVIGYAPTRRSVFSREDAIKYKGLILDKIKSYNFKIVDIDDICEDGLLVSEEDTDNVIKKFKENNIDCVFSPHCNFGTEYAVAKVAKEMQKPFLLWGPRDEAPLKDGTRLRDTQCGLFATSKILQRYDVPFTYIVNSRIEDVIFERGFLNFIKAVNVVKEFRKMKIGQIGLRPGVFWTVICNEGELLDKFNIEIVPFDLFEVVKAAEELLNKPDEYFNTTYELIKNSFEIGVDDYSLKKIVALKEAMKKIALDNDLSALCIQCWNTLQSMYGIVPCFANGLLTDDGIPVICETDINGAISSVIAKAAVLNETPPFFADLTIRHPSNDNGELLWHCGPFPPSLKRADQKVKIANHWILESHCPGIGDFELKGGDISVVRFESHKGNYFLFCGHAKGIEGPKTLGTYLWIGVNNWPAWEQKLINGPYIHHIAGIHKKIAPVLYEAIKYIKGVELDLIDPTESEIRNWLYLGL